MTPASCGSIETICWIITNVPGKRRWQFELEAVGQVDRQLSENVLSQNLIASRKRVCGPRLSGSLR
jgi:hypothetical protein